MLHWTGIACTLELHSFEIVVGCILEPSGLAYTSLDICTVWQDMMCNTHHGSPLEYNGHKTLVVFGCMIPKEMANFESARCQKNIILLVYHVHFVCKGLRNNYGPTLTIEMWSIHVLWQIPKVDKAHWIYCSRMCFFLCFSFKIFKVQDWSGLKCGEVNQCVWIWCYKQRI